MKKTMFNAHDREFSPMDFPSVNYKEFLHEPYILEPILEPRFPVESASFGPSQAKPGQAKLSQAEPSTSSTTFTKLPVGMSFTALMGLLDSRGSSDSTVEKLS